MLHALRLRNFRCFEQLSWDIPARGALLLGDNARGKTSLMEAVSVALTLHSPREVRLNHLARHGTGEFGISLDTDTDTRRLVWHGVPDMRVNGIVQRDSAEYLRGAQPAVWLGNRDAALIYGSAERRRNYLDFLGSQWHPMYRTHLWAYRRALRSRNMLLHHAKPDPDALHIYTELLANRGEQLVQLRLQLLELLRPHVSQCQAALSGGRAEQVTLRYMPSAAGELLPAIEQARQADLKAGCTTLGPHRDDVQFLLDGRAAASYASEGQQRTLAVSLVLAQAGLLQAERGAAPILLVDDIFGELDPARRRALLRTLPPECQTFITATHLDWLGNTAPPLPVQRLDGGRLQ